MTKNEKKTLLEYKLKDETNYKYNVYPLYNDTKNHSNEYLLELIKIENNQKTMFDATPLTDDILRNHPVTNEILNYLKRNLYHTYDEGEILRRIILNKRKYKNVNMDLVIKYQDSIYFPSIRKSFLFKLLLNNYKELNFNNIKIIIKEILTLG
jgi:hypothetical protein